MLEAIVMCFVLSNLLNVSAFLMWSVCVLKILVYCGSPEESLVIMKILKSSLAVVEALNVDNCGRYF